MKQYTIRQPAEFEGRGLFTGEPAVMRFKPASPHHGVVFHFVGDSKPVRIAARDPDYLSFFNVNSQPDLDKALALVAQGR